MWRNVFIISVLRNWYFLLDTAFSYVFLEAAWYYCSEARVSNRSASRSWFSPFFSFKFQALVVSWKWCISNWKSPDFVPIQLTGMSHVKSWATVGIRNCLPCLHSCCLFVCLFVSSFNSFSSSLTSTERWVSCPQPCLAASKMSLALQLCFLSSSWHMHSWPILSLALRLMTSALFRTACK